MTPSEPEPVACLRTINENDAVYSLEYWIRDIGCERQICEMLIEQVADNFSNAAIRLLQTTSSID